VAREVQGVPAAGPRGEFQHRSSGREADAAHVEHSRAVRLSPPGGDSRAAFVADGRRRTFNELRPLVVEAPILLGDLLDLVAELGIAGDTIVMYSTDNGPHMNTWPDGAMTPFRNEKNSNLEGAFRVTLLVRWPGKIPAGIVVNDIVQHHDSLPTFLADVEPPKNVPAQRACFR